MTAVYVNISNMENKTIKRIDTIAREIERRRTEHGSGTGKKRAVRRFLRRLIMFSALVFFVLSGIFIFNFFRLNSDLVEGYIKQGIIPNLTQGRFNVRFGSYSGSLLSGIEFPNVLIQNPNFKTSSTLMTIPRISMKFSLVNIFWGKITLEKLEIDNPVLTLKRNENGRGIWDFSQPGDQNHKSEKKQTSWQKREQTAALADNYLSDIRVNNLSILIPSPAELIVDEFLSRLTRFPTKTYQFSGINLSLKKYPAEKFISHILSIAVPSNPEFLRFQVTRTKQSGNFTLSFDAIGQNFNFAVENLGLDGRKVNFYDGRMRDRLNLEWIIARKRNSVPEKIIGLNGVLRVPDFKNIFAGILAKDSIVEGALEVVFKTDPGKDFYDTALELRLKNSRLKIPFVPEIQSLDTEIFTSDRRAEIRKLQVKIEDIESIHKGIIDYKDAGNIKGHINANIMGDLMEVQANYNRQDPGIHKFSADVQRNSGEASVEFKRYLEGKNVVYRDFKLEAGLVKDGKAVDILPLNILPKQLGNKILAWFERIDLIGPFRARTGFSTLDDWQKSELDIDFNGSKIVNKLYTKDSVELNGHASLASGVFTLDNLRAGIDKLEISVNGHAEVTPESPFISDYSLAVSGGVKGDANFKITSERLQKSFGLANLPDFDQIELKGSDLVSAKLSANLATNSISLNMEKFRFLRHRKPIWFDNLRAGVECAPFNLAEGKLPGPLNASLTGAFFGISFEALLKADVAAKSLDELSFKGGGSNFSKIIEAIISQPEGRSFFSKYPMNIAGAFNFAFIGTGLLKNPALEGWIKFPTLSFSYSDVKAKMPFHATVKTDQQNYIAQVNAGQASLQVGPVNFDLGKTTAKAEVNDFFIAKDPLLRFSADSEIFSTRVKADGKLKLASKKIDKMNLQLKSGRIENLAKEIARIGQFKIPFEMSGEFDAAARLSGPIASPNSDGSLTFSHIGLDFPLLSAGKKAVLSARKLSGKASFSKKGTDYFGLEIEKVTGSVLDAEIELAGAAHLKRQKTGFKPGVDSLKAKVKGLDAAHLANYLLKSFLPEAYVGSLNVESGKIDGTFNLSGNSQKMIALGQASISGGKLGYRALKEKFEDVAGILKFEGRSDSAYARISVENVSARFGRSLFKVSSGYLEDPFLSGKVAFDGAVERVYPTDLISMMGGMKLDSLSFPEEGWLDGALQVTGTLFAPLLKSKISSSKMKIAYRSEGSEYLIPIGENEINFSYNPENGAVDVEKAKLQLLNGEIVLDGAKGSFARNLPFSFSATGQVKNVDLAQVKISDADSFRGIVNGSLKAAWEDSGARDAVFNLVFKNLFIPKIPVIDPAAVGKVGIDFIEQPDFREGQLNFYVTTEEEADFAGKLLIADGLFAGPHLRLELGNSEFNPQALKLTGKLMINPQSLRKTSLGKKLGRLSATVQDRKTGIPYLDLNLAGTWDKPELLAKSLEKSAKKRGKRNFIKKLFGARGPHKASVEELMQWFPGWKKGM